MSAWGANSFQNDWAMDWVGDLLEGDDFEILRNTLRRVVVHGGTKRYPASLIMKMLGRRQRVDWLTAGVSSKAIAAAEIVAAYAGHPSPNTPEKVLSWMQQHPYIVEIDIILLAGNAVRIIKGNSELKDLWAEGDWSEWKEAVEDLERRLDLPAGPQEATDIHS